VKRKSLAVIALCLAFALQAAAADTGICKNLFDQGYYDVHSTFDDRQNFHYIQSTICSDTTLTKDQADQRTFASGGTYMQAISGFLNLGDQHKSFEEQRTIFCSMSLDTATASSTAIQYSRVVSQAAAATIKACLEMPGFHAVVVPSTNHQAFTIEMKNVQGGNPSITVTKLHLSAGQCDLKQLPANLKSSEGHIACSKPEKETIQVSMDTDKGGLSAIDVYGTDKILPDLQNQVKVLADKVSALESKPSLRFERIPPRGTADACQIIQDLQVCWGMIKATQMVSTGFTQNFSFANPFEEPPQIVFSPVGEAVHDIIFGLFNGSTSTTGGNVQGIDTTRDRGTGRDVYISYMAIGRPAATKSAGN
jgi:hypothetical protein